MNRQARFSLASKGFLSAAVIMLIMGAERPLSQPLSQAQQNSAERIGMYDAQPIELMRTGQEPQTIDYRQAPSEQRWVF
ncbi:hypothetical protein [Stutzerimonas kunmingensis]|jgi:hypothetical protein|uniref:hypothetical protein n=1 Tax=Stutzerimonas stutzeri subgroup TaxID=578833 RepID=UPI000C46545F|nr:hypothetical protein [Stutzerimonas kunmingensis]MAK85456.1 hypothetical protein [Pseudomonas sp.]MCB4795281.1 hypothetical protein [Pseudomonas sp. NP21570]MCQ2032988.1 hypothetical protein [Stutzerimonas kunmingensis]UIP33086.1 hypothetical protein LW136_01035 [Stutzerimonas kunmingensis]HCH78991.1 hypothetical protein [Pseudomonas sp.]|tara:strand:+ start:208 stop:444 length:237 start_codon:yes stop_codon:yes gene_type:complete